MATHRPVSMPAIAASCAAVGTAVRLGIETVVTGSAAVPLAGTAWASPAGWRSG